MAAAEAEGRNLLLPVDDAEVWAASLACCVSACIAMPEATVSHAAKSIPISCNS